ITQPMKGPKAQATNQRRLNLRVVFRLCLEVKAESKKQTEQNQENRKANREPVDAAELQIKDQRRQHCRPNSTDQEVSYQLTIVALDRSDLEIVCENALTFLRLLFIR